LLFAVSAVSATRSTRLLGGIEANFWRISLATVLLGLWSHTAGAGVGGKAFPCFLLSGCVGYGVGDLTLYQTLPRLGARLSILLVHCLAAPFAALVEWAWLGTTLTPLQIGSSITILIGVALAIAPDKRLHLPRGVLLSGIILGTLAAFGQGFGAVLSRKAYQIGAVHGEHIDGLSAAYQRIVAGWVVAAVSFALVRRNAVRASEGGSSSDLWRKAWIWVVVNAFAGPALGVGCYQWALATRPTGVVLPIVATTPIAVIPLARVIERERPRTRSLLGGAIAVAGAVILAGGAKLIVKVFPALQNVLS
jgi:drug/metabolite transporter (DMT)-like permease